MAEPDSPLSLPDGEDKEANKIGKQLILAAEDDADGRHAPITSTRKRRISRITMSSTNPRDCSLQERESIIQQEENGESLRSLHRRRLRLLLKKLLLQRNWSEASGVLSVLLKATVKDASESRNRSKYLATLQLMQHIKGDTFNQRKIQNIFDLWMKKLGAMEKKPSSFREPSWMLKDTFSLKSVSEQSFQRAWRWVKVA